MTDQSVFQENDNNQSQGNPQQTQTPDVNSIFANHLAAIKNEQGQQKYGSVEEALKGAQNAQEYIPQLKSQMQEMQAQLEQTKAELAKRASVEEVVSKLTATQTESTGNSQPAASPGLTEEAVQKIVASQINQTAEQQQKSQNELAVQQALVEKYGDKAADMLATKASELGSSKKELQKLAQENPKLVLSLFGESSAPSVKPTTTSTVSVPNPPKQEDKTPPALSLLRKDRPKGGSSSFQEAKKQVYSEYGIDS